MFDLMFVAQYSIAKDAMFNNAILTFFLLTGGGDETH
jgi:hypothetical protein